MKRSTRGGWWLLGTVVVAAVGVVVIRGQRTQLMALAAGLLLERPAARLSYPELAQQLEQGGEALQALLATAPDSTANREQLRHIIGIERWGQARLAALVEGSEPPEDGHRPYKPAETLSLPELAAEFVQTRARTAALARQLGLHPPGDDLRVRHNGLGPLSGRGWLRYLNLHASFEGRRIRQAV